ncbi:hypothetical protein BH708_14900 [Brachybacterium sp. P6-10-X1]|nr:hypothetical protein BH708_14900 [Brachybacterium sp. P6-10-X1]
MGVAVVVGAPMQGDPFWDPIAFSWPLFGIFLAIAVVLTIGFVVWMVLQPEEPDHDTTDLVDKATEHDRDRARTIRRRLDADSGRADASEPELR